MLIPRQAGPALQDSTLDYGHYDLATDAPSHFSLEVFYRGLPFSIFAKYLLEHGGLRSDFAQRGVKAIAISSDSTAPGVFIVRPAATLQYNAAQTMPFARPQFQDLLGAIDFALAKDYPVRWGSSAIKKPKETLLNE